MEKQERGKKNPQSAKEFMWKILETKHPFACVFSFNYNFKRQIKG